MYIYNVAAMCNFADGIVCCTLCTSGVKIEFYESYKIIIACGSKCRTDVFEVLLYCEALIRINCGFCMR
jgi:hypothetical protein